MRKKIIFLEAVQNYGGARISTLELAERLQQFHSIKIVDFYGTCKPFIESAQEKNIDVEILEQRDSPYIINSSSSSIKNIFNRLGFIPHLFELRSKIHTIIDDYSADYIVVNNYKTLSILLQLKLRKTKVLFFARGWFVPQKISLLKKLFLKSRVDKYICVAEATRHALFCGGFGNLQDLYVVHNAIDEGKLSQDILMQTNNDDTTLILHAGGFLPEKGQEISLEIAKILKSKGRKFKIVLAGLVYKGQRSELFYKKIQNIISEFQLEDFVTIVEGKTNIIPYFRACDIVIHPSNTEGLPRVVMEAMCLKKPVVANAVGGVTDFILSGFTGFITDYNSVEDYVFYLEKLMDNHELYNSISENGYNLIKTSFTSSNQVHAFNKILK